MSRRRFVKGGPPLRTGPSKDGLYEGWTGAGRLPSPARLVIYAILLSFLILFYFYPLASILRLSLTPEQGISLEPLSRLFRSPRYLQTLWFTVWQAALSTGLTVILALPGCYVFARYDFPGKSLIQALTTVPFVLPTMVVSLAFTALLGPRGLLNLALMRSFGLDQPPLDLQHTLFIIILAHVFYNYTLVLRIVGTFWSNLGTEVEEAARMLGSSRWRALWEVTLPLLAPSIAAAAVLVFIFDFTSFGVILVLGGARFATLEVEIYRQTVHYLNLPLAAVLSMIQIVFTFGLMALYTRIQANVDLPVELRSRRAAQRVPRGGQEVLIVGVNLALMLVMLVTPLVALVVRSFTLGGDVSLMYYRALFRNPRGSAFYVPPVAAVRNSVGFALAAVVLSVALGLLAASLLDNGGTGRNGERRSGAMRQGTTQRASKGARPAETVLKGLRRLLDPVLMLPLGTSAVTLGLGYIVALDEPPLDLRTSPLLVVLAHTLVALPFVVRSVLPALRSIRPQLRETAAILGASPWRVWREVDLPIVARAVVVGAVFAFTVSMGEFGATSLIARPERPTMPVAIFRFLSRPGLVNYGQALAMSALLMLVCTLGFLVIERFRVGGTGEF